MEYGFLDEAGDVGIGRLSSRVPVVAVVLTATLGILRREVKKFRTRLGKKRRQIPELTASQSYPVWNSKRLERLAKLHIEVMVAAVEKTSDARFQDPEELYRLLYARAVEESLQRFSSLTLCVDGIPTEHYVRSKTVPSERQSNSPD